MVNYYDDVTIAVEDIFKDRYNIGQHDVSIQPGSTLPTSKWAELGVYMEAYQMGLIDRIEVLKKNPEIFDKEGVIKRMSEIAQLRQTVEQMEEQVKTLEGDLQTAQRESVSDRKRVEVEKFKSKLVGVKADAEARGKVQVGNITNAVKLEAEKFKSRMGEEGSAPDMFETL